MPFNSLPGVDLMLSTGEKHFSHKQIRLTSQHNLLFKINDPYDTENSLKIKLHFITPRMARKKIGHRKRWLLQCQPIQLHDGASREPGVTASYCL